MKGEQNIEMQGDCFFCNPDETRIIMKSENFYAILGLGPVVEGYTIIASKLHYKSTLDLPDDLLKEQNIFKNTIKNILKETYGPSIAVEHGRIEACTSQVPHENHCFHSHQLIFPVDIDLIPLLKEYKYDPIFFSSLKEAKDKLNPIDEYLFFENTKNETFIAIASHPCRRQFLRFLVGLTQNKIERADWTKFEGWEEIKKAKTKLIKSLHNSHQKLNYELAILQ